VRTRPKCPRNLALIEFHEGPLEVGNFLTYGGLKCTQNARSLYLVGEILVRLDDLGILVVVLAQQERLDVLRVEALVHVPQSEKHVRTSLHTLLTMMSSLSPEVTKFSHDSLHAGDHVVHEPADDSLVHGGVLLGHGLHVEELHQRLDRDALHEHGPVHDGDRRRHEHGGVGNFLRAWGKIKRKRK
jgi:hypothetical protein